MSPNCTTFSRLHNLKGNLVCPKELCLFQLCVVLGSKCLYYEVKSGFQRDPQLVHQALIKYLEQTFAMYLIPPSLGWDAPFSLLWQSGRKLVLAYNYPISKLTSHYVWPGVSQQWANSQSIQALQQFLVRTMKRKHSLPWSAMAELTPSFADIILGRLGNLRQMAYITNPNVTDWYRGEWGSQCNIVSVDFIRNSGVVSSAIDWNLRRARGQYCDNK